MPDAETNTTCLKSCWMSGCAGYPRRAGGRRLELLYRMGRFTEVRIFSPLSFVVYGNLNDESVVCRVSYGDMSICLPAMRSRLRKRRS
jgi:hypothetical protein